MASVTVNLTGVQHATDRLTWLDDVSLGSIFSFDGDNIGLSHFAVYDLGNVAIGLTGIGDRFTTAFEATGRIIAMSSDGETLEVMIANADMTEPYFWVPSNSADVIAFLAHVRGLTDQTATLTLTDDPPGTDHTVDGGNLAWGFDLPEATVTHTLPGVDHTVNGGDLGWGFQLPEATVTHTIAQTLALSDFDDSGLDVEAAAVLVASAPGTAGNNLYADSDRGGTDTPLEGELGLGPDDVVISRIRHGSETVLSLNDNNNPASLALDDFFEGDGNGLTLYLQTEADGVVSFDVADQLSGNRNSSTVRFTLPADAQTLLNNIPDGGRFIFALAQPAAVTVDHVVDGGDLTWGFAIPEATVTHTLPDAHAVDGGSLEWGFNIPEATVTLVTATPGTVSLTGFTSTATFIRWSDDQLLGSAFSLDGGDQTLSDAFIWYTGGAAGQVGIYLAGANDRFTAEFEATGTFTFTASDGETLAVQIADVVMSEPYLWIPTNSVGVIAFANHVIGLTDHDATLTLTGEPPPPGYAVDGGDIAWGFAIPQATVTIVRPPSVDHAINGGDLAWGFDLPEAAVTLVAAPVGVDHTVNGGDLSWGFQLSPATVTIVAAGPVDHTVNGGSLSWGFHLPRARVAHSGIAEYTLEVDWDNNNSYANANADVWRRVIEGTFRCKRGRNFASQRSGRSVAGSLEVQLDNRDGLLDPDNTASALNSLLSGGRRVRWRMNDGNGVLETQWTGWLRTIEQIDRGTGLDRIRLRALGVISRLNPPRIGQQQQAVVVGPQTNIRTGAAARLVFDPAGTIGNSDALVDGADYRASYINGSRTMARWWAQRPRLIELRDLEQTEVGFLWEPKDGFVGLDDTSKRQAASAQVVQANFTDVIPGADEIAAIRDGIKPDHPFEDLANIITSAVRTYGVGTEEVLWEVTDFPIAGASDFNIVIRYPHEDTSSNRVAVSSWTALAVGVDYQSQSGVTLTMTTEGNEATIRIESRNAGAITMNIQIRGRPVIRNNAVDIITPDADSVEEHGPAPYPFAAPWLSNPVVVSTIHGILLRLYGQPAERLTLTWEVESDRAAAAALDISDRVEVMRRGEAAEYFIESIRHRLTPHFHFITMTLSPAGVFGSLFVIGVSRYGQGVLSA